ncbi:TonB-dependent receptor [Aquimarina brevivitae]|uniref:Outer membrane receptor protein involved in Fe transport n=1 Tax=Aquimarina brevivitae TaxID=323412 RepID=A0A4Q7P0N3_9FLAO|nr:TonB-dependent receptor plug domain-containing protein [Aquimarina brevivitae]RZS93356.1 outer membrane receptor protein involved in Fe transport [Aquimarina brevivitae]
MKLIYILLILGISSISFAQNAPVKGTVKDVFEQPVEGAYIYNSSTDAHTHSLANGRFVLQNTTIGDTLTIRSLGYQVSEVILSDKDINQGLQLTLKDKIFQLDELVLQQEQNPIGVLTKMDIKVNPVNSSQEILRKVPGLFIGQHAGGGKAEQIFLRGFDIDHGTDIAIDVDGLPVNMVSHAHGQGYSDLHFLIPETIDFINFGKGSYEADQGNFATAGHVSFTTKERFDDNLVKLEVGDFNTLRTVGLFNLMDTKPKENAVVAVEYQESDGPFESPQNFNRINIFSKYTTQLSENKKLSLLASYFDSRWSASGQIPQRAVDQGLISRFGAIDDTEGGKTSRTNIALGFDQFLSDRSSIKTQVYYTHYDFELYSNFTFFLNDPVNGDQIKQKESRNILGAKSVLSSDYSFDTFELRLKTGIALRNDRIADSELSSTANRTEIIERRSLGDINETNFSGFFESTFDFGKLEFTPSVRLDYFKFIYEDFLQPTFEELAEKQLVFSPKFRFDYDINTDLNLFLKSGVGFHSNDTRVVLQQDGSQILPKSYASDLGVNYKPLPNLFMSAAAWYLALEQEFVYVGDEGIVEPSGSTERYGIDFSLRQQFTPWLFLNTDLTYTKARATEAPSGQDYIPLAPQYTFTSGVTVKDYKNLSAGLQLRWLGDRPANEDYSITAEGYTVVDFNVSYQWNALRFNLDIQNLFDVSWNETQFATESRLANESESVEEIHFTPGTPFFIKGGITYSF